MAGCPYGCAGSVWLTGILEWAAAPKNVAPRPSAMRADPAQQHAHADQDREAASPQGSNPARCRRTVPSLAGRSM